MTEEQFDRHTAWQKKTFPSQTPKSMIIHFVKETNELIDELLCKNPSNQSIKHEFADCFLLLYGAAKEFGITYDEIQKWIYPIQLENKNEQRTNFPKPYRFLRPLLKSISNLIATAALLKDRLYWCNEFPNFFEFSQTYILLHFSKTFKELYVLAITTGLTQKDINDCIEEKQAINMKRKWANPDSDGVVKHIES